LAEKRNTGNAVILNEKMQLEGFEMSELIELSTLDDYFFPLLMRCDFIKMDIEGFEVFVLRGGEAFIANYRPIIYGEFSQSICSKMNYTFKKYTIFVQIMTIKCIINPIALKTSLFFLC
jgi:Methyltransferase FkbM domain